MADGHWAWSTVAAATGSTMAIFSGGISFLLALSDQTSAAWAALMVAGGGLATALGGQATVLLRTWLDSLRLKEQLAEAHVKITSLEEKGKRDRATIRRNFTLIKGMMERMSHSTVLEIVRIQEEKDAREKIDDPGKSLIFPPFDVGKTEEEIIAEYEPPSEHDLGPAGDG